MRRVFIVATILALFLVTGCTAAKPEQTQAPAPHADPGAEPRIVELTAEVERLTAENAVLKKEYGRLTDELFEVRQKLDAAVRRPTAEEWEAALNRDRAVEIAQAVSPDNTLIDARRLSFLQSGNVHVDIWAVEMEYSNGWRGNIIIDSITGYVYSMPNPPTRED